MCRERSHALPPRQMLYLLRGLSLFAPHLWNGRRDVLCLVQMHVNNRGYPFMNLMRQKQCVDNLGVTHETDFYICSWECINILDRWRRWFSIMILCTLNNVSIASHWSAARKIWEYKHKRIKHHFYVWGNKLCIAATVNAVLASRCILHLVYEMGDENVLCLLQMRVNFGSLEAMRW